MQHPRCQITDYYRIKNIHKSSRAFYQRTGYQQNDDSMDKIKLIGYFIKMFNHFADNSFSDMYSKII